jgi:hypothetical protein
MVSTHPASDNPDTATFFLAGTGAPITGVEENPDASAAAHRVLAVIDDDIDHTANSFTVELNKTAANWCDHNGSYALQLHVSLQGARYPLAVRPTVRTTRNELTATQSTPRVALRASGRINLMDRGNTQTVYVPRLTNSNLDVLDNQTVTFVAASTSANDTAAIARANQTLNVAMVNGNAVVTAKSSEDITNAGFADIRRGERFRVRLEFTLTDGTTKVTSPIITIRPNQSAVRHAIPRVNTVFQSRSGVNSAIIIDVKPTTPAGARVRTLEFRPETAANERRGRFVNNPNNAYAIHFDPVRQELHVWVRDSALVIPGRRVSLTFQLTYEGQGLESSTQQPRQIQLRVPVTVR